MEEEEKEEEEKKEEEEEEEEGEEEEEEEEELEEQESEENEFKDTSETETFPFEGRACVKQQRNSLKEESHYTTSQNGIVHGSNRSLITRTVPTSTRTGFAHRATRIVLPTRHQC